MSSYKDPDLQQRQSDVAAAHTAIPGEMVTTMVVKGLITRDALAHLALTDRGRAVFRAMLPDL
jgi:hypothetical protein